MNVDEAARSAFEQRYAADSGMTVEQLHYYGRFGAPCDCGEDGCEGWQMSHAHEDALFEAGQRRPRTLSDVTAGANERRLRLVKPDDLDELRRRAWPEDLR